ncbi:MAG TPA: membrane protein insertion efficiency factor YidD [Candidatus Paceibacterota bacterium]
MKGIIISSIRFYQHVISPDKGVLRIFYPVQGACPMYPSCSEYMVLAIEKYGAIKGIFAGILRIGRCHPFQKRLLDMP